jgi:thymidylate kinase
MNNSKTYEIQSQINKIPLELNNEHTTIFLSAGGNDILDKYVEGSNANLNELDYLNTIFGSYKNLVKAIKTRMNKSKLVILDVYYPTSTKYLPYKNIISEWNKKIYDYAKQNYIELLKVSAILTKPKDFSLDIEPSESGGEKLADAIHSF